MAAARGLDIAISATTDRRGGAARLRRGAVVASVPAASRHARSTSGSRSSTACSARRRRGPAASSWRCGRSPCFSELCAEMEEICPDAWIFNYTNPVNLVAEAVDPPLAAAHRVAVRGADLLRRPRRAGRRARPLAARCDDGRPEPRLLERGAHLRRRGRDPRDRGGLGAAPRRSRARAPRRPAAAPGGDDGLDPGGVLPVLLLPRRDRGRARRPPDHARAGHHELGPGLLAPLRRAGRAGRSRSSTPAGRAAASTSWSWRST